MLQITFSRANRVEIGTYQLPVVSAAAAVNAAAGSGEAAGGKKR
jgi:hypothetical protein